MKDWRTSVVGALGAAAQVLLPVVGDGALHSSDWVRAVLYLVLGLVAADSKGGD